MIIVVTIILFIIGAANGQTPCGNTGTFTCYMNNYVHNIIMNNNVGTCASGTCSAGCSAYLNLPSHTDCINCQNNSVTMRHLLMFLSIAFDFECIEIVEHNICNNCCPTSNNGTSGGGSTSMNTGSNNVTPAPTTVATTPGNNGARRENYSFFM